MAPAERNRILRALFPDDRNWIFRTFDHAPDMQKRLMLTGVWLEYDRRGAGAKHLRYIVTNSMEFLKHMSVVRCLHCHEVTHAIDRHPGHPLCRSCAADLVFLGHDLRETIRKLRCGEKIA